MTLRERARRDVRRTAFTLMEMLVVVAIIVALAGIGGYYFLGQANQARINSAKLQVKQLTTAVETYANDHANSFPASLDQLFVKDEYGGPYLKSQDAIIDPWGRPYQYDQSGQRNNGMVADIWFVQPDGREWGNWMSLRQGTGQ